MTRPVNVVHVTLGLDVGGQEKLLVEMARHADRERFRLHVVSLTTRGLLAGDIEAAGWPVTALEAPQGLRPGIVARLARLFRRLRADVVHTHDDRPNIYGAPAGKLAGCRVIHTRHHQGTRLTARQRWLIRGVSAFDDRFVCISDDSARWAVRQGVARRKVCVRLNGIDLSRFAYSGSDPGGPAVIVARLSPEKSIDTLLRAVPVVLATCPDFRLEVAGDGPCREALAALAAELRLGDRVRFLGTVGDVPALLARARLFVLSSLTEGVSLTLLEASARGLPIVATAVGGNPEVVADGITGLLVPAASPDALAGCVLRLWGDVALRTRMGEAGRKRVEERFDVRRMVAAYEAMYRPGAGAP
jgi:glycosyltransferase involved in cell wall biosynthesis